MRGSSIPARAAWAGIAAAGLILLCLGLGQTFYFGSVTNAFARDQIGNTLILAGPSLVWRAPAGRGIGAIPCGSLSR
jgi:hypothetical protein